MAKVIYAEEAKPLSLKGQVLITETLVSNVSPHLDPGLMYQGLPSTLLLTVKLYILRLNNFSGLIWPLYTVGSCDCCWSIQGYNISPLSLEQALFHGWLSIPNGPFLKSYFHIMIKAKTGILPPYHLSF